MRTIYTVLLTAAALGVLKAQGSQPVMVGMPEYGVALSGTPEEPVIENHSGKVIIGYNIDTADANGRVIGGIGQILAPGVLSAGLPDGKSLHAMGNFPVDSNIQRGNRVGASSARRAAAAKAALTCLIFEDGHFVGTDERGVFDRLSKELKAVKDAGILAKTGAWDQLEDLAQAFRQGPRQQPPNGEDAIRQLAASRLVETWRPKGDVAAARAAVQLAEIYSSLPTPWK